MNYVDKFINLYRDLEEENKVVPVIKHGDVTFAYVKYRDLFSILLFHVTSIFYHSKKKDDEDGKVGKIGGPKRGEFFKSLKVHELV